MCKAAQQRKKSLSMGGKTRKQTQKFKANLSHSNSSAKTVGFAMIPMYIGCSKKSLSVNH